MQHPLLNSFYQYWLDKRPDGEAFPTLGDFPEAVLSGFDECGLILKLQNGEVLVEYTGDKNASVLTSDLHGRPITDLFSPALKPLQMSLVMVCFQQGVGMVRLSRLWFGHRHKDVEWLLLPVMDNETGSIAMVGLSTTFVEPNERDYITVGSSMVERIIVQNYLALGKQVDLGCIDGHGWAVLDTMGAKVCVDEAEVEHFAARGIAGEAGMMASKVSHANVLAVAHPSDFGRVLSRLGARYNLKIVETLEEARAILHNDMIDVLVTAETVNDVAGLELIKEVQSVSAFTACVMMLDPRDSIEDKRVIEDGRYIHCIVKPVGEFALRKAVDDANTHVLRMRQDTLSSH